MAGFGSAVGGVDRGCGGRGPGCWGGGRRCDEGRGRAVAMLLNELLSKANPIISRQVIASFRGKYRSESLLAITETNLSETVFNRA